MLLRVLTRRVTLLVIYKNYHNKKLIYNLLGNSIMTSHNWTKPIETASGFIQVNKNEEKLVSGKKGTLFDLPQKKNVNPRNS